MTVHAEVHANAEAPVEQVCAELEPPVQELDTHGKKPENQPHHFVLSSEPTAPLFFSSKPITPLKVMRSKQANKPHQFLFK